MSRRFLYFAFGGLLAGVLIIGMPYLLEGVVEAELADRLVEREVDMRWERLDWRWPASIELGGVEFAAAGGRVSGQIERVEVGLDWAKAFSETRRAEAIDAVEIEGAALVVDLEPRSAGPREHDRPAPSASLASTWKRLADVGALEGRDVDIELERGATAVAHTTIEAFSISAADAGERRISASGSTRLAHRRLAGLGLPPIEWRASGSSGLEAPVVDVEITAARSDRPLVDLGLRGHGTLRVDRMTLRADAPHPRSLEVRLHQLAARLGAGERPAVELDVDQLALSRMTAAEPTLDAHRPELRVAPGQLIGLRRSLAKFGAGDRPASSTASSDSSSRGAGTIGRLAALVSRVDATVDDGSLVLHLADDGGAEIRLIEEFSAVLRAGQLWARAKSSGGRVGLNAHFEPGMVLPRAMTLYAADVRLEALPGVSQGRTLPQRGVRGRIGGVVDLELVLLTDGEPLVRPDPRGRVTLAGSADWRGGHIDLSGLADAPLDEIDAGVEFALEWAPEQSKLELREAQATYGPIEVDLEASLVDWPFDPVFDLEARVDEIACQEAVRALPAAMLGPYANTEIDGEAAPRLRFSLPFDRPQRLRLSVDDFAEKCQPTALGAQKSGWPEIRFAAPPREDQRPDADASGREASPSDPLGAEQDAQADLLDWDDQPGEAAWPVPEKLRELDYALPELPEDREPANLDDVFWLNRPFIMQISEGVSDDAEVLVGPGTDDYVPLEELPSFVGGAAYLSEEMGFWENDAVQLGLIEKALRMDLAEERFVYGGSTVTQQLVKNLFLTRAKTLARKLQEALISWRVTQVVPKWRVLELYLNCIEYAQDVYGIGPAAEHYFGKDARELTPKEAVFIAILKPAPWYGDRFRRKGTTPKKGWWHHRIGEILQRLVDRGHLTQEQADAQKPYILQWDDEGVYMPGAPVEDDSDGGQ